MRLFANYLGRGIVAGVLVKIGLGGCTVGGWAQSLGFESHLHSE